jgi:PEP-CTERM motif
LYFPGICGVNSIAPPTVPTNNELVRRFDARGVAMKHRKFGFAAATLAFLASLPIPAAAEMVGVGSCTRASWSALAMGECRFAVGGSSASPDSRQSELADPLQVVVEVPPDAIPEPETYALMLVGLVAVVVVTRRRRRR